MSHVLTSMFAAVPAAAMLLGAGSTKAAESGLYVGAAFGDVASDYDWAQAPTDLGATSDPGGFKVTGGVRPLDPLAIEVDYVDFGRSRTQILIACPAVVGYPCPDGASIDTRALSASVLGIWTLATVDVFGRVGIARWDSERAVQYASASSDAGTDPLYGAGVQLRFGRFALRIELERYERARGSVDLSSVGFVFTFF